MTAPEITTRASSPAATVPWDRLERTLQGSLVRPTDLTYDDERRTYNGMFDRRPAAIARCQHAADVSAVIHFTQRYGLPICVRGGGHGVTGVSTIDGAVMIDVSNIRDVVVDAPLQAAWVGAGLRLGDLQRELESYGFVSPTGTVSDTGMAGLTLGGGFGYLVGRLGMAIDNVLGAEMVLADGSIIQVNEEHHPDLFWAIRGGGGNFGVVTRFHLRIHPLAGVTGGMILYPYEQARAFLRHFHAVSPSAPDDLTTYAALLTLPDGNSATGAIPCWSGAPDQAEAYLAPLRSFGPPLIDTIQEMPYSAMNLLLEAALPWGLRLYWKQTFFRWVDDDLVDRIVSAFDHVPSPLTTLIMDHFHGVASRVAPDATAFPHRDYTFGLAILSSWTDSADDDRNISWTRELADAVRPWSTGGVYSNESTDEPARAAFGLNWDRLRKIKTFYDPNNVFSFNTNIPPLRHDE